MSQSRPYTDEEIRNMWEEFIRAHEDASPAFKILMSWAFDYEEFSKVMKIAHLPNPFVQIVKK